MTELNLGSAPGKTPIPRKRVPLLRILIYLGIALFLMLAIVLARFFSWAKSFDLHAFRSGSSSMCPTICENEFFIAGMDAYSKRAPERGEVILFDHDESGPKWIKRVIAVGGDTVAGAPADTILVNGKSLTPGS